MSIFKDSIPSRIDGWLCGSCVALRKEVERLKARIAEEQELRMQQAHTTVEANLRAEAAEDWQRRARPFLEAKLKDYQSRGAWPKYEAELTALLKEIGE